jgi:hypothetical protein
MDSNLRRSSGRFAGFAVRTLIGFSLFAGCNTTAVAQENPGLIQSNGTSFVAIVGGVDAHNHFDLSVNFSKEAK